MQQEYFQIFENGNPLINQTYRTHKEAVKGLNRLYDYIATYAPPVGYKVEKRLNLVPTRTILGIRKIYADGAQTNTTYVIKHVKLAPIFNANF
jgi:hypothetical protein